MKERREYLKWDAACQKLMRIVEACYSAQYQLMLSRARYQALSCKVRPNFSKSLEYKNVLIL